MNGASDVKSFVRNAAIVATSVALWGALVLLFAAPLALTSSVSWRQAVAFGCSYWALWLVFLPLVAWLSFRFPIERKRLFRNVALHMLACLVIVGASRTAFRTLDMLAPQRPRAGAPGRPPLQAAPGGFGVFLGLRAALDVLVYWSLFGLCQAVTNFRSSQERERRAVELEARLASAQLQALRMQINPHFLFNTLNSIAALVHTDPRAADEMLGDLSDLMRRSLDAMEEQEITLAQELDFIGSHMRIEQKRFGDRLRLEQNVPEDLRTAMVPVLILQPLVENAIRHGIEPRRGPGLITIEARADDKHLRLIVRDNGRGLLGGNAERRGIGLSNTEARLRALYGSNHSFTIAKAEPQGCEVNIRLPLRARPTAPQTVSSAAAA